MTRVEAQTLLGLTSQANFRDRYLLPGLDAGLIEMTIPEKPNSSKQRYLLTSRGRLALGIDEVLGEVSRPKAEAEAQAEAQEAQVEAQVGAQAEVQEAQAETQEEFALIEMAILGSCRDMPQTSQELLASMGHLTRSGSFKKSLSKLLSSGLIELTLPDKPRSPKQRYRITSLGRQVLANRKS